MVDVYETAYALEALCHDTGVVAHPMILTVLNMEREDNIMATESGDSKTSTELYLAGNNKMIQFDTRLQDRDAALLRDWLSLNQYVTGLDLRYNNIADEGACCIAELITKTKWLRRLNLMCNDFGEEGAKQLAQALHTNKSLRSLRLNGNKIGNQGGLYFAQALQVNVTLQSLDLADCDLDALSWFDVLSCFLNKKAESLIALSTVLQGNRSIHELDVSRPILSGDQEETTVHFAQMLKTNQTLKELHLMKHNIWDFGAARLSENLRENFTLTYLNLSCNKISADGARDIADLLKRDTSLKVLDLSSNRIRDDGAVYIADALSKGNMTLVSLDIRSNDIGGRGLCAIAATMKSNTSLAQIYIWGNNLNDESGCIAFRNLCISGRLEESNTDVLPYLVDGRCQLSQLSNGLRPWYYWGPCYGANALPALTRFTQVDSDVVLR